MNWKENTVMGALLFFDIDGTLITLDESHSLPESAKLALYKAKENGHKVFINTGRVKTAIDKHLLDFGFDGLVCGCGTYIEYQGKVLLHRQLEKNLCLEYAKVLHECGMHTVFEGVNRLFIDGEHGPGSFLEYIYDYFSKNTDASIDDYCTKELIYDKFTTSIVNGSDEQAFRAFFADKFNLIPHGPKVIEAVPNGYSKATGIDFLMKYLDVSLEQVYTFGDSINDMEMLQFAKHSVGMGNAVNEVFDVVEYVTTDVKNDGISRALEHYALI